MIREYEGRDLEKLVSLWKAVTKKAHFFIDEGFWDGEEKNIREIYVPLANTYVYEKEKKILGFIAIIPDVNMIGGLFVEINSQGKSIGKKLIEYVKEKNSKNLKVEVFQKNEKAKKFYHKMGFKYEREYLFEPCNEISEVWELKED